MVRFTHILREIRVFRCKYVKLFTAGIHTFPVGEYEKTTITNSHIKTRVLSFRARFKKSINKWEIKMKLKMIQKEIQKKCCTLDV